MAGGNAALQRIINDLAEVEQNAPQNGEAAAMPAAMAADLPPAAAADPDADLLEQMEQAAVQQDRGVAMLLINILNSPPRDDDDDVDMRFVDGEVILLQMEQPAAVPILHQLLPPPRQPPPQLLYNEAELIEILDSDEEGDL